MTHGEIFTKLESTLSDAGADAVLQTLDAHLEQAKKYHELFEVAKMRVRRQLKLPLTFSNATETLEPQIRDQLEDGLLDACRRVGLLLLQDGRLRDGWHYLRAVGDRELVEHELAGLEPTDENLDEFIELMVHEGVDLRRGFQLMLKNYGTCNTITTFDSVMYGQPRAQRAIGAALLVAHLHAELKENVRGHIERQEGQPPADGSLLSWIESRDWLFADGTYHLDTTHLASVVGFARDLDLPTDLELASELAEYGRRLDEPLQYNGDPPFQPLYPHSLRYFRALLGDDINDQLEFFKQQAEAVNPREDTTMAIEVYIELLSRVGKSSHAIKESMRLLPEDVQQTGRAPSLIELADACGRYDEIKSLARQRNDALGFALGLLRESGC